MLVSPAISRFNLGNECAQALIDGETPMAEGTMGTRAQKDASAAVARAHARERAQLPFGDTQDFADATRGFVATVPNGTLMNAAGKPIWSMVPYAFQQTEEPPVTVNPSLWRQARLNLNHGLYEVVPGVYQVRGFDIANMTLIEGERGVIVVDTLTSIEGARSALKLYRSHRGDKPVTAVIYTHTHTDHWGGSPGVVEAGDVAAGRVPVIAPDLFMHHTVSENVTAGNAMLRRSLYQFGRLLPPGPKGHVDCGLGKTMSAGAVGLVAPNDLIIATGDKRIIDGVEFEFQMAPNSEAPAEMHFYVARYKLLCLAENATHNFHNLLPFRGSQVRDAAAWSGYLSEALKMWGGKAEALVGQHHWPVWDAPRVDAYVKAQRDLYKYVHDQTVRLMNTGLNAAEIAEALVLPDSLAKNWHTRDYYGTVKHNSKAIYQHYLGWYDGNPANLDPLPRQQTGAKTIEYMGGVDAAVARAREDFGKGEFRWVAQVMSHAVFSNPAHEGARTLLADAFEQLGYLSESSTWRNAYLFGAHELRNGMPQLPARTAISMEMAPALSDAQVFDTFATRVDGPKAAAKAIKLNWYFTDRKTRHILALENGVLNAEPVSAPESGLPSIETTRAILEQIMCQRLTFDDAIAAGTVVGDGANMLREIASIIEPIPRMFELVEPRKS